MPSKYFLGVICELTNTYPRSPSLIRTIGAASTVLLKNDRQMLPLQAPKSIAIIGDSREYEYKLLIDLISSQAVEPAQIPMVQIGR